MAIDTPHNVSPIAVFDLDGTLADTAGDLVGTLNVILEQEGLAPLPVSKARDMIGAGARALIQRGFEAAGKELTPAYLDELFRQFMVHYGENICVETRLYPGVGRGSRQAGAGRLHPRRLHQQGRGALGQASATSSGSAIASPPIAAATPSRTSSRIRAI